MKEFFKDMYRILKIVYRMSKVTIVVCFLKSIIQASLPFVNIIFSARLLDGLLLGNKDQLFHDLYWMITLNFVLGIVLSVLKQYFTVCKEKINLQMREYVTIKALQLDYEQLETKQNMELVNKASEGSNAKGGIALFIERVSKVIGDVTTLIYAIIIVTGLFSKSMVVESGGLFKFLNSNEVTVGVIVIFFVSIILNIIFMKRINQRAYKLYETILLTNRRFKYFTQLLNTYPIHKEIRIYKMRDLIYNRITKFLDDRGKSFQEYNQVERISLAGAACINQIIVVLAYIFVGAKTIVGIVSVGNLLKYVNAFGSVNKSITSIVDSYSELEIHRVYLKSYFDFLNLKTAKYHGELPIEKRDDHEYQIEFRNVSFHYPNSQELILKNVSLKMDIGKKMAIVGPNGAGKTTFIKLLCRLYDPSEGEILLNGIDIKKYDYQEYLDLFSVVFQDFKLFSLGIAENVATSKEYDENLVWDVLKKTGVKERVAKMRDGLQTQIYQTEEDGVEISGGEAQKIAISRALYKDASIVILDEPTSALDPISEYEIYANFNDLVKDKTSIYISHRMSSCRFCDVITVFDHGRIIQSGSHEELISSKDGLYYQLWNAQAKNYN